jgi:hypothetical protein
MSIKLLPIKSKSGNLVSAGYDPQTQTLQVRFKGGSLYEYSNIKPELYDQFEATFQTEASSGSFFHRNFRNLPFRKI